MLHKVEICVYYIIHVYKGEIMNKKWTEYEKEFIRVNADRLKDEELLEKIRTVSGRPITLHALRKVRQSMGVKKKPGRGICAIDNLEENSYGK